MLRNIGIVFAERDRENTDQLEKYFQDVPTVKIMRCKTLQINPSHCIVCPSNSYGLMDDNLAHSIDVLLGAGKAVRSQIDQNYYGEQPVGTCMILPTCSQQYVFMAHLPVSRAQDEDIGKTKNAYLAFRALLVAILNHNKLNPTKQIVSILCPSLCTQNGMSPKEAARQMRVAYGLVNAGLACSYDGQKYANEMI